jgi:Tfp pilus assembly protein PilO
MQREIVLLVILLLIVGGFWFYGNQILKEKTEEINNVQDQIEQKQEELISAQIINRELDEVVKLIERNLASSEADTLLQEDTVPFLKYLTPILEQYNIVLLGIEPKLSEVTIADRFVRTPYSLKLLCEYSQFGQLVATLERSERLISVEEFVVNNEVSDIFTPKPDRTIKQHEINMLITTVTLLKEDETYATENDF